MITCTTSRRVSELITRNDVSTISITEALRYMVSILASGGTVKDMSRTGIALQSLNREVVSLESTTDPLMKTLINIAGAHLYLQANEKLMTRITTIVLLRRMLDTPQKPQTENGLLESFAAVNIGLTKSALLAGQSVVCDQETKKLVALPLDELVVVTELSLETGRPFETVAQTLKLI